MTKLKEKLCELGYRSYYDNFTKQTTYYKNNEYLEELLNELNEIKSVVKEILVDKYNGVVPNNRQVLESMPGVGRKTANVVLSNLFDVPCIAVDTHVFRLSKRLGLADEKTEHDAHVVVMDSDQLLLVVELLGGSTNDLVDDGNGTCLAVIGSDGQGDTLAVLIHTQDDELAGLSLSCHHGSFDLHQGDSGI